MATLSQLPAVQSNAGKTCRLAARCFVTAWPAVCGQLRLPETSAGRPAGPAVPFSPAACCHSAPGRQHSDSVSRLRGGCRDGFFQPFQSPASSPFQPVSIQSVWIPANRGKCERALGGGLARWSARAGKGWPGCSGNPPFGFEAQQIFVLGDGIAVASVTVILGGVGAHHLSCGCCFSQAAISSSARLVFPEKCSARNSLWLLWWMATFQRLLIRGHSPDRLPLGDADVAFALIAQRCLGLAGLELPGDLQCGLEPVFRQFQ